VLPLFGKMLSYVLICLCLALTGVAGLQMMYLLYFESLDREKRKRLSQLEQECIRLRQDLAEAQQKIAEQAELLESSSAGSGEEAWADVIEER